MFANKTFYMSKCRYSKCEKTIEIIEKKKPKKYCSPKCRLDDFYERKRERIKLERQKKEEESRNNQLINAARGRDESGINEDEIRQKNQQLKDKKTENTNRVMELLKQISEIEKRKCPSYMTSKKFAEIQKAEITKLENEIWELNNN